MKKTIKIKTLFGTHQIYQELVNYPPEGVNYMGVKEQTIHGKYYQKKHLKAKMGAIHRSLNVPRMALVPEKGADLIHSSRGFIILNKKSWVIDIEHPISFTSLDYKKWKNILPRAIVKKYLSSLYCKKIMPHCIASEKSLLNSLDCSKFKSKIETLYPATHVPNIKKRKHDKIRILYVSSMFFEKGGLQVLRAFKELEKKYENIELWIKSDVPEKVKKQYNSKNIKYFAYRSEILPRETLLQDFYAQCDIFLYPTFIDTFGFGILDAMSCGIPIVANNTFAIPEFLGQNNSLLLQCPIKFHDEKFITATDWEVINKKINQKEVSEQYTKEICEKISILVEDAKLRRTYGRKLKKEVESGKFSIKTRNKKLRRVYEDAMRI